MRIDKRVYVIDGQRAVGVIPRLSGQKSRRRLTVGNGIEQYQLISAKAKAGALSLNERLHGR